MTWPRPSSSRLVLRRALIRNTKTNSIDEPSFCHATNHYLRCPASRCGAGRSGTRPCPTSRTRTGHSPFSPCPLCALLLTTRDDFASSYQAACPVLSRSPVALPSRAISRLLSIGKSFPPCLLPLARPTPDFANRPPARPARRPAWPRKAGTAFAVAPSARSAPGAPPSASSCAVLVVVAGAATASLHRRRHCCCRPLDLPALPNPSHSVVMPKPARRKPPVVLKHPSTGRSRCRCHIETYHLSCQKRRRERRLPALFAT